MKHWSVDTSELEKDPAAYAVWQLEEMINFGLRDGKIDRANLITYWDKLDLDPAKKKFLALLIGR